MLFYVTAHALLYFSKTDGSAARERKLTAPKPPANGEQLNHG